MNTSELKPIDRMSNWLTASIQRFRTLPGPQKLVLVAGIVLLYVFAQNVVNLGARQEEQQRLTTQEQSVRDIEDGIARIGAALIYDNVDEARGLARTVQDQIAALPDTRPWSETEALAFEKEALGLYMSGHPIERHRADLQKFGARTIAEFTQSESDVWIGGIVSGIRQLKTKKGDRMAVFVLEDATGTVEVVVFPEAFGKHGALVESDLVVLVRGKLEKDDETSRLVASELQPIATLRERMTTEVAVHLSVPPHHRGTFEAVAEILARHRGDRRVALEMDIRGPDRPLRVRADVALRVRPSERLVSELEALCGRGTVELR